MTQSIPLLYSQKVHSAEELLQFYRLDQGQLRQLHGLSDQAMPMIEEVLDHFYDWMRELPDFMAFFQSEASLQHVRAMQSLYWKQFLQADVNEVYLGERRKIGEIHARIGLPVMFYMAGVSMVYDELAQVNQRLHQGGTASASTLQAMASLLHMDAGLICQAFVDKRDELLNEQSQAVLSMSTPVTEIWDGILLLPVVGIVDSKRSEDIMNAVLTSIRAARAKEFILDISGVGVVDTAVANYLISISKATGLMGCRTTISGISPAISKTIIQLGIDIGDVNTTATMMDALAIAFANRGLKLKQVSAGKRGR